MLQKFLKRQKKSPGLLETSKMECFVKTLTGFPKLTIIAKLSILDVCENSGKGSGFLRAYL